MAPQSSTLAWKIPWMEEPGGLQSMGSLRVGHDWATSISLLTFMHWRRKWQPTPVFLPGESQGPGAWWATIYGVAQSLTRLKRLSSSSSRSLYTERQKNLERICMINKNLLNKVSDLIRSLTAMRTPLQDQIANKTSNDLLISRTYGWNKEVKALK